MFDSFDVSGVSIQRIPNATESRSFLRQAARHQVARVAKRERLRDLVGELNHGETWHLLTSGDLDAGHVLDYLVAEHGPFSRLYLSTWSMERHHIETLAEHLRAAQFSGFIVLTGDYFAQRSPANYTALVQLADQHNGEVYRFNNHSKLMAMATPTGDFAVVVEGSANFTRNPRTENCCITVDRDLYDHVAAWFKDLTETRNVFRL
jgi:hypothetical protein